MPAYQSFSVYADGLNNRDEIHSGGLSLGWGWAIPWQNTYQRENEISYNHITHWMGTRGSANGLTVQYNHAG